MKKVISILGLIIVSIIILIVCITHKRNYVLNIPDPENISIITLKCNKAENEYDNYIDINKITNIIKGDNRKTKYDSISDFPTNTDEIIEVNFISKIEGKFVVYVYKKNNRYYIEQPYNGIYKISRTEFDKNARIVFSNELIDRDIDIDVDRIFDEFYTVDISRTKGGTGLGLAIAKEFTKQLGGNIYAKKIDNKLEIVIEI